MYCLTFQYSHPDNKRPKAYFQVFHFTTKELADEKLNLLLKDYIFDFDLGPEDFGDNYENRLITIKELKHYIKNGKLNKYITDNLGFMDMNAIEYKIFKVEI